MMKTAARLLTSFCLLSFVASVVPASRVAAADGSPSASGDAPEAQLRERHGRAATVPPSADGTTVHANAAAAQAARLPIFGVGADVGLPDGMNVSLVTRPFAWARLQTGIGSNGISYGWRTGATLLPFRSGPAAIVEYGHYHEGNANGLAGKLIGSGFRPSPLLRRVGYDYVNLHLGLNLGYQRFVFFVQGGLSFVRGQIYDADQAIRELTSGAGGPQVTVHGNPTVKATGFGAKLGLIAYVW